MSAITSSEDDAVDLLGQVIDWFGAPDWDGPLLPDDLGRRIAQAADRHGWWAARNGSEARMALRYEVPPASPELREAVDRLSNPRDAGSEAP